MELVALQDALPEIVAMGATLVAISPELPEHNREVVQRHGLTFELLSDAGNRVARAFGLVFTLPHDLRRVYTSFGIDLATVNGDDSWTLPMPARFVIDPAGGIRVVDVDPDYTKRPEPTWTVQALRALASDARKTTTV